MSSHFKERVEVVMNARPMRKRWVPLLVLLAASAWADAPPGRYALSADVVSDLKTGLHWQRSFAEPGMTQDQAETYCQELDLNGTGWRLPTMKELQTIVDETRVFPAIDLNAFPDTPGQGFATASRTINGPSHLWSVLFDTGVTHGYGSVSVPYVRCVR